MNIAILTFQGFNELDSFIALGRAQSDPQTGLARNAVLSRAGRSRR
jgi:hypothetical protein